MSSQDDEVSAAVGVVSFSRSQTALEMENWSAARKWSWNFVQSRVVENSMAALISLNVVFMVWEVNKRAYCRVRDIAEDEHCNVPFWVYALNTIILWIYVVEIIIRLIAFRWQFFTKLWNYANAFVVFVGLIDWALSFEQNAEIPNLTVLRLFRLFKLFRTVNLMVYFPELYELLRGFAGAVYAMLWGSVLIATMLAVWSMLAVEVMPTPRDMQDNEVFPLPPICNDVFESVPKAMLFFFQTLVAGDSWGVCCVPIIRHNGYTILVFLGALISVSLGVTNLILAVIVDAAAGAREKDQEQKLRKKMQHEKDGLNRWQAMVQEIDTDGSGTISLQELVAGFDTHPEVRQCFQLLDIDHRDLHDFFALLDHDQSGGLSYAEFFHDLQKAHTQDTRMYLMSLKLQISHLTHMLNQQMGTNPKQSTQGVPTEPSAAPTVNNVRDKVEQGSSMSELRSTASPRFSDVGVSDAFFVKLQAQLDQLTQDASAQAATLVQNTKMLEALLASCDVEDPSKSQSPASGRQVGGAPVSGSSQLGFSNGRQQSGLPGRGRSPGRAFGRNRTARGMTGVV